MSEKRNSFGFVLVFAIVWTCFGIIGLIDSPEKKLLITSQFVAAAIHFVWAFLLWRRSRKQNTSA